MEEISIFPFYPPPSPITTDQDAEGHRKTHEYETLRKGLWRDKHIIATDGSKMETDGSTAVGAAWYDASTQQTGI